MDKIMREMLDKPHIVTVWLEHNKTKNVVKITMEGNGLCCYDLRNRMIAGWPSEGWAQIKLHKEVEE